MSNITLDDLAVMVANGFSEQREYMDRRFDKIEKRLDDHDRRFDEHDRRFDEHDKRFNTIDKHLSALYEEIRSIRSVLDEIVTRKEFEALEKRIARLEQHLGLAKP